MSITPKRSSRSPSKAKTKPPVIPTLLQLPAEIRDRIYYFALKSHPSFYWPTERLQHGISPALLVACRQIYEEAAPLLYHSNTFTFVHPSDANVFRWVMDRNNVQHITKLSLRVREKDVRLWIPYFAGRARHAELKRIIHNLPENIEDDVRSLQADFPNLRQLQISFRSACWSPHIDPEENYTRWVANGRLRALCVSLPRIEGPGAQIGIVCSIRVPEQHLDYLEQYRASDFHSRQETGDGWYRLKARNPTVVEGVGVTLELQFQFTKPT